MDAAAGIERIPVRKHHIPQPKYGEWAGSCGTGRPNLSSETKFSGTNGNTEMFVFPVKLTTSRIDILTRLIITRLYVMTINGKSLDRMCLTR